MARSGRIGSDRSRAGPVGASQLPAVVLYNGFGSRVDGLWSFWKTVARKEDIVLLGPTAFAAGAWRIPEDSPGVHARRRGGRQATLADRSAPHLSLRPLRRRPITCCRSVCSNPNTSPAVAAHAGALVRSFFPAIEKAPRTDSDGALDRHATTRSCRSRLRRREHLRGATPTAGFYVATLTELPGPLRTRSPPRGQEVVEKALGVPGRQKLAHDPVTNGQVPLNSVAPDGPGSDSSASAGCEEQTSRRRQQRDRRRPVCGGTSTTAGHHHRHGRVCRRGDRLRGREDSRIPGQRDPQTYGVPVPQGEVAFTPDEARATAERARRRHRRRQGADSCRRARQGRRRQGRQEPGRGARRGDAASSA